MKNDILKISIYGYHYITSQYTIKQVFKDKQELIPTLLELKTIAENPYDKRHDLAEFLLGFYGAYEILNKAQDRNEHKNRNNLKQLEQLWREDA